MKKTARSNNLFILTLSVLLLICVLFARFHHNAYAVTYSDKPFARLFELICLKNRISPLHPIGRFKHSTDFSLHAANMAYLQNNSELLEKIKADLGEKSLEWHLKSLADRLLYVPENRPEYIALYEAYCLSVINEILDKIKLSNPYSNIITLTDEPPQFPPSDNLCAYIVHNLSSEVRAKYEFRNSSEETVAIELSSQHLSGEVGSYSSFLSFDVDGNVVFTRNRFTIWQNSAQNPYTALMTPVEETLHIAFRENTESAIKTTIENKKTRSTQEAKKIVDDWISVEEALVGGLVHFLLPPILEKQVGMQPLNFVSKDIETKSSFKKYRYLKQGINLVESMGYKAAIQLYRKDPIAFRKLL